MDGGTKTISVMGLGGVMAWGAIAWAGVVGLPVAVAAAADNPAAIAQTPDNPASYAVIHVNATAGHDAEGDGSQLRPYRTITHALNVAETNTLILLAGGIYSADSGESFPLRLRSGVTVQGMAGPNAAHVVIRGSGTYRSVANGLRQITVLGADNAGLANVTVSNSHPEGTGLWIESGSPIVLDSAFFRNGAAGIYIAGPGAPVIRGNYFAENGRAGLVIAGPSTAKVEANTFENTGAGITVAPESSPEIVNNQISGNLDGLIVHAEARPRLQGNEIVRNRRNSIVDYAAWTTVPPIDQQRGASQPPPPTIAPAEYAAPPDPVATVDTASAQPVSPPAEVTAIAPSAVNADVNAEEMTTETVALPAPAEAIATSPPVADTPETGTAEAEATIAATPEITTPPASFEAPATPLGDRLVSEIDATAIALNQVGLAVEPAVPSAAALANLDLVPVVNTVQSLAIARTPPPPDRAAVAEAAPPAVTEVDLFAPLPASGEAEPSTAAPLDITQSPEAVEISVIPPPTTAIAKPEATRTADATESTLATAIAPGDALPAVPAVPDSATAAPGTPRLAVPNADIPLGTGGSLPETFTAGAAAPTEGPPPPPSLAVSLGLNYKVLVVASNANVQAQVQARVPDAFRTRLNGQLYIQAGAYPTLEEAQAMLNQLRQAGLPAQIEEIR